MHTASRVKNGVWLLVRNIEAPVILEPTDGGMGLQVRRAVARCSLEGPASNTTSAPATRPASTSPIVAMHLGGEVPRSGRRSRLSAAHAVAGVAAARTGAQRGRRPGTPQATARNRRRSTGSRTLGCRLASRRPPPPPAGRRSAPPDRRAPGCHRGRRPGLSCRPVENRDVRRCRAWVKHRHHAGCGQRRRGVDRADDARAACGERSSLRCSSPARPRCPGCDRGSSA